MNLIQQARAPQSIEVREYRPLWFYRFGIRRGFSELRELAVQMHIPFEFEELEGVFEVKTTKFFLIYVDREVEKRSRLLPQEY